MIIDTLANSKQYYSLHPAFKKAFETLCRSKKLFAKTGTYEIDGRDLYVIVLEDDAKVKKNVQLEAHRKYIDIQYVVSGTEEMAYKAVRECRHRAQQYNKEKDYLLFSDSPESWLTVPQGYFAIFFPQDAHGPMYGSGRLKKAVIKIRL